MHRLVRTVCLAALAAGMLAPGAAGAAPTLPNRLGAGAVIGAQVDPLTASAACTSGRSETPQATVLAYGRPRLEADDGTPTFTALDRDVDRELGCGLQPLLRLSNSGADEPSTYPSDPEEYAALLEALAAHEKGRVERYAIENEVNAPSHFSDTPENYFALLHLASDAIHAGDPDAIVLDSTFASGGISLVRVNELYAAGQKARALALLQEVQVNELGGGPPVTTEDGVGTYLADPKSQRVLRLFDVMLANQDAFDAFQFHYYGPSQHMAQLISMLRRHGMDKPIEAWEVNHRYLDERPFDEADFADEVSRLLATAVGEGSRVTVFSRYADRSENAAYGLTDGAGGSHRARYAFRTSVRLLSGATRSGPLRLAGGALGYSFQLPRGRVAAFWALSGSPLIGPRLGISATSAAVTENEATAPKHLRLAGLRALASPRYAEPDLPVLSRRRAPKRRAGKRRGAAHPIRMRVACPAASPFKRCAGKLRISGKRRAGHGRRLRRGRLGSRHFDVARGRSHDFSIVVRRGEATLARAEPRACPGGLEGCHSWLRLR